MKVSFVVAVYQNEGAITKTLVKLDAGTRQFIQEPDAAVAACGIAPGAPFLGRCNIPGPPLALDAEPVGRLG